MGDLFEVTIRNWNTCNPYNDPNIPGAPADPVNGDHDPVTTTAIALIVDIPDGSVNAAGPFCETDPPFTLNAATSGGTWSGPGVDPATGVFTPTDAGAGIHTIDYDVYNAYGCASGSTIDIEVRAAPAIDVSPGTAIHLCPGLDLQLNANINGGTPPHSIQWTGDTGPLSATDIENPQFNTSNIGSYTLTAIVTDDTGCSNESDITIDIETVSVEFDPNPVEICAGSVIELSPVINGGSTNFTAHSWSGQATSKLSATNVENPEFLSTETGTFTFTYTVTDDMGCSDQTDISVIVKEQPTANAGSDNLSCSPTHQLSANDLGTGTGQWQTILGSGTLTFEDQTSANSTISADTYGTYELMWSLDLNGCSDFDLVEITFSETPVPATGNDFEICGLTTVLEAIPDIPNGSWSVTSGPGNITFSDILDPLAEITADTPGNYSFTWTETSADGCTAAVTQMVEMLPQATASAGTFTNEGCSPLEITFNNTSVNAGSYQWDFGDGSASNDKNPVHIFQNMSNVPDTFTVVLEARNNSDCNDSKSYEIIINPVPVAMFEASDLSGCSPLEIAFANTSSDAIGYLWDFGDGTAESEDENPSHIFSNSENYIQSGQVKLTAENDFGCIDHHTTFISIYPVRDIELSASPGEGCARLTTRLTTQSGAKDYSWDFGDGNTLDGSYETAHVFENNSNEAISYQINVTGTSSFGCLEEASTAVLVHPSPQTNFEATPMEQQMPNRIVSIINLTPGTWHYEWTFGDGQTSTEENPGSHQFENSGNYEIALRAFSQHCEASTSNIISIISMVPAIDYGQNQSGCPPLTVSFYNNTLDAASFLWAFGDDKISQEREPTHTFRTPGTYQVKLTAYGPGGNSSAEDVTIEVYETPTALFEPVPKVVYVPNEGVNFINKSQGGDSYIWHFGDDNTSTNFTPTHIYNKVGSYDVTLYVRNNQGCEDEMTIPDAVKAVQGGEINLPNAFTPNKNGSSDGKYRYGERSNHVFYPFVQKGIVEYQLQIFSRWGELLFESNNINRGWDGYYRDKLCPQGVYIWRITATFSNGKRIEKAGDVTLLR